MTWRWVREDALRVIHERLLAEHGGAPGLRDEGGLDAALARPRNKAAYGDPALHELAAAYAFGIARAHPFVDGNKRVAAAAMGIFVAINGYRFTAPEAEMVVVMRALAAGELSEDELAAWIAERIAARP